MIWNSLKKPKKLSCSERNTHLYILLKNGPISSPSAFLGFSAGWIRNMRFNVPNTSDYIPAQWNFTFGRKWEGKNLRRQHYPEVIPM